MEAARPASNFGSSYMTDDASFWTAAGTIGSSGSVNKMRAADGGKQVESPSLTEVAPRAEEVGTSARTEVVVSDPSDHADQLEELPTGRDAGDVGCTGTSVLSASDAGDEWIASSISAQPHDVFSPSSFAPDALEAGNRTNDNDQIPATITLPQDDRIRQVLLAFNTIRGSTYNPDSASTADANLVDTETNSIFTMLTGTSTDETPFPSRILHLFPRLSTFSSVKPLPLTSSLSLDFRSIGSTSPQSHGHEGIGELAAGMAWLDMNRAQSMVEMLEGVKESVIQAGKALLAPSVGGMALWSAGMGQVVST